MNEKQKIVEEGQEKKSNRFTSFFKDVKNKINNSVLESEIYSTFKKNADEFEVYKYGANALEMRIIAGYLITKDNETHLEYIDDLKIEDYSVIYSRYSQQYFYVLNTLNETIEKEIIVNDIKYIKNLKVLKLDKNVQEVKVIKANDKFFVYKGK